MGETSLQRRIRLAGNARFFWESVGSHNRTFSPRSVRIWELVQMAAYASRIGIDLVECVRTLRPVPSLGQVEMLFEAGEPIVQHPRYASFLVDRGRNAMTAMLIGVDLIRSGGRYYLIENNHGPSLYKRRRTLYGTRFDPIVETVAELAKAGGFARVVPISLRWEDFYLAEFRAAGAELGVPIEPMVCPLRAGDIPRIVGLPVPLERDTMYLVHGGLWASAFRYLDNKSTTTTWLAEALGRLGARGTRLAMPRTREVLDDPLPDNGPRWPNLVVKLANGQRSEHVVAGRFESAQHAREALGLDGGRSRHPRLRQGWFDMLAGRNQMLFQDFIPPELDGRGHPRMIRLFLLLSPHGSAYIGAHNRIARTPLPERMPSGVLENGSAFVFNDADYELLAPEHEAEIRTVAEHLGAVMKTAVERTFRTVVT